MSSNKFISSGCDPGLVNFAFSIIKYLPNQRKVLHSHMVKNRVTDLKINVLQQRLAFYKEIRSYLIKYKPSVIAIERFMVRGRFGQSIAECISFMLGILSGLCAKLKIKFQLITASSWKNAFHRALKKDLKKLYKFLRPLPPHIVDSVLQATYAIDPTYKNFSTDYLKQLRATWKK